MLWLSTIQFGQGCVAIVSQAAMAMGGLEDTLSYKLNDNIMNDIILGYLGIWFGIIFCLSGILGIWAAKRPSQCSIITAMALSSNAVWFCVPFVYLRVIDIETTWDALREPEKVGWIFEPSYEQRNVKIRMVIDFIQLMVALVQFVVSIPSSVMACSAVFCGSRGRQVDVPYQRFS